MLSCNGAEYDTGKLNYNFKLLLCYSSRRSARDLEIRFVLKKKKLKLYFFCVTAVLATRRDI